MWPELSEIGTRTLAAQFAGETANGTNCCNFNFGNMKAGSDKVPHNYLASVCEIHHLRYHLSMLPS